MKSRLLSLAIAGGFGYYVGFLVQTKTLTGTQSLILGGLFVLYGVAVRLSSRPMKAG
jgi:hypothetical protein